MTPETPATSEQNETKLSPVWLACAIALAGLTFAWAWTSDHPSAGPRITALPIISAALPDFSMTDTEGHTITRDDLAGDIWVADFIFTRCAGPCPKLSERMRAVQYALADYPKNVKLVSFSLDPVNDTPAVLKRYAKRFNADASRWSFLTNNDETVMHRLVARGFLQSVVKATDEAPLTHSVYFVVVDGQGRIRACHNGIEPGTQEAVLKDIDFLLAEHTGT